jgi:hypothetical protein
MDAIEGHIYSPYLKTETKPVFNSGLRLQYETTERWERFGATVNKIRRDKGYPVSTFRQLIDEVAYVTINNRNFEMYYRGQTLDHKDSQSKFYKNNIPKTIIYPSICRPERKLNGSYKYAVKKSQIEARYKELYGLTDFITQGRSFNPEYYFALFQHYNIIPTPLIDITQSLRSAASFALEKEDTGFVYVFGLPYPNQSISHFTDLAIVLVKLQNICPVKALRPRYQEGYLVGKYPFHSKKTEYDNLARRLVAKFKLDNSNGKFWDKDFLPMPKDVLYPVDDPIESQLINWKKKYDDQKQ